MRRPVTTDGRLFCVGLDEVGQVGVDPATLSSTCQEDLPCQINWTQVDSQNDYATVVSGYDHGCALKKSDGSVWCYGSDLEGQLGRSSDEICFNGSFDQPCGVRPIPIAPIE